MIKIKLKNICIFILITVINNLSWAMNAPEKKPVSIQNISGSCYINALMQTLYNIDEMTQFVLNQETTNYYKPNSLAKEYINFLKNYKNAENKTTVLNPTIWCSRIRDLKTESGNMIFPSDKFGDAAELFSAILDHLEDKDIQNPDSQPHYGFPFNKYIKNNISNLFNLILHKNEFDIMNQSKALNFQSELLSTLSLSLFKNPMEQASANNLQKTLTECLETYFEPTEGREITINNEPIFTIIQKNIIKLPKILTIQYKRWDDKGEKIYQGVKFPLYNLNLSKYLDSEIIKNQQATYDLIAVIMHHGRAAHYTSYIKRNNQWYNCNDKSISPVSEEVIKKIAKSCKEKLDPTPYILFYKQRAQLSNLIYPQQIKATDLEKKLKDFYNINIINYYLQDKNIKLDDLVNGINDQLINIDYIIKDINLNTGVEPIFNKTSSNLKDLIEELIDLNYSIINLNNRLENIKI